MAGGRNDKLYHTVLRHETARNIAPFFPSLSLSVYFANCSYIQTPTWRRVFQFQIYSRISEATSHLQCLGIAQGGTQDRRLRSLS